MNAPPGTCSGNTIVAPTNRIATYRNHGSRSSERRRSQPPQTMNVIFINEPATTEKLADADTRPTSRLPMIALQPWARKAAKLVSAVMLFHWRYSVSQRAVPVEAVGEMDPKVEY